MTGLWIFLFLVLVQVTVGSQGQWSLFLLYWPLRNTHMFFNLNQITLVSMIGISTIYISFWRKKVRVESILQSQKNQVTHSVNSFIHSVNLLAHADVTNGYNLLNLKEADVEKIIEKGIEISTFTVLVFILTHLNLPGSLFDSRENKIRRVMLELLFLTNKAPIDFYEWREVNKVTNTHFSHSRLTVSNLLTQRLCDFFLIPLAVGSPQALLTSVDTILQY